MRISDWSSDVCSSDLREYHRLLADTRTQSRELDRRPSLTGCRAITAWLSSSASARSSGGPPPHASRSNLTLEKIGRAHVLTPVTNAPVVCRTLHEKKNI